MKKLIVILAVVLLCACSALPGGSDQPTVTPRPAETRKTPTPEPALSTGPTVTPSPSAVTPGPAQTSLPTLQAGGPVALTGLQMVDAANGWGIESSGHILRTQDGGSHWQDVTPPQGTYNRYDFFALDARAAWALNCDPESGQCSLLRTADSGRTWTVQAAQLPPELSSYVPSSMMFTDLDNGLAKTYDVGAGQADISVYKTLDGGATWNQVLLTNQDGVPDSVPGAMHICNICADTFYYSPSRLITVSGDLASDASGAVHVSISTDLGKTWKDQVLALPARKYADGLVDPAPLQPVFFNEQDGVLPFRIIKYNADYTPIYDVLAVYATHDGGQNWQTNPTVLEKGSSLTFITPQDAFAVCGKALCVTHDAAHSWQRLPTNLNFDTSDPNEHVEQFSFINISLGWALTVANEARALWQTTDGGKTWQKLNAVLESP